MWTTIGTERTSNVSDTRVSWAALNLVLAHRRKLASAVLTRFPDPVKVLAARPEDLSGLGLTREEARALFPPDLFDRGLREVEDCRSRGIGLLTPADGAYPPLLREVFDPPLVLYCWGRPEVLAAPSLGMVGARRPTAYGKVMAESLARQAARAGLVVVSGMAFGIDTRSHCGALETGRTVAVLGSGLDVLYPPSNRDLARKIAEKGAVISEYPLGSKPLGFHFPLRNRIISGLSLAVVVVEAGLRSGSLITAKLALEQNRDVLAVPGNATSTLSAGTNWLIQSGAKLVGRWEDVLEELPASVRAGLARPEAGRRAERPALGPEEARVWDLLKPDRPTSVDEIVEATDLSVSETLAVLLGLELKAAVLQGPGQTYTRRS
jgi:DNA processing protein